MLTIPKKSISKTRTYSLRWEFIYFRKLLRHRGREDVARETCYADVFENTTQHDKRHNNVGDYLALLKQVTALV